MTDTDKKLKKIFARTAPIPRPSFSYRLKNKFKRRPKIPENEKWWTTLYYGARGSGKSQHQAKEIKKIFAYLDWLYWKNPKLKQAIVYSVQKFNADIENKYLGWRLFYWTNANDLKNCPRPNCWRGSAAHRLHGCYLIYDDIAAVYPNKPSFQLPEWKIKMFSQGRKFGVRILANCQDAFSVNLDFRRYTDMAFKFSKIFSTRDPDETKPALKFIFGVYRRRKIAAQTLWEYGDMSEAEIVLAKEKEKEKSEKLRVRVPRFFRNLWKPSWHIITRRTTEIYDTTQEVAEYQPKGYLSRVYYCIDPLHNHKNPRAKNFCKYKKVYYDLV